MPAAVVVAVWVAYAGLLFAVAAWADRRAAAGRSVVANPWVYTLSLTVYATSWTYYGSVGRAAGTGLGFLPVYLGPTLMAMCWWVVLRRVIHVSRRDRLTSLADFAAARYGRSGTVARVVTLVAVVGVVPYIALQLLAAATTFDLLVGSTSGGRTALLGDTALWVALALAAFTVLFGTRHLDASERHEGLVAAVAVEAVVKLVALLAVGIWVCVSVLGGAGDLLERAADDPRTASLFTVSGTTGYTEWFWVLVVSGLAALLLPRQWQVAVVENVDPDHLRRAVVGFPLYLLLANVFVLPIALAGLLVLGPQADADTYVLSLPLAAGHELLALVVFVGGVSAATGMVVVETVALATMVSNSFVVPLLLRRGRLTAASDLSRPVLLARRVTIVVLVLLGWGYVRAAGRGEGLVAIGLVSFAAVAQLAPAVLGGLFWRGATRRGAVAGTLGGFAVWVWTLLLPSFARDGRLPESFVTQGPWGVGLLAPESLLGLDGLDRISHAMVWSTLVNVGLFVGLSVTARPDPEERLAAALFVDAVRHGPHGAVAGEASGAAGRPVATVGALVAVLGRLLGPDRARAEVASGLGLDALPPPGTPATPGLVHHVEAVLAGAVGTVSARVVLSTVVVQEPLGVAQVLEILDEASRVRAANTRLRELDRMKDDFVSTVSHELRTPLTSIRAFSEILLDEDDLPAEQRREFLGVVVAETERLTRLINQVLDLSKLESGSGAWDLERLGLADVVRRAVRSCEQVLTEHGARLVVDVPDGPGPQVLADEDRLVQVVVNLLSNAAKFAPPGTGTVAVGLGTGDDGTVVLHVDDDGPGVPPDQRDAVFDKFHQVADAERGRPAGTGLGLPISREIVARLGGRVAVADGPLGGARFTVTLPPAPREETSP